MKRSTKILTLLTVLVVSSTAFGQGTKFSKGFSKGGFSKAPARKAPSINRGGFKSPSSNFGRPSRSSHSPAFKAPSRQSIQKPMNSRPTISRPTFTPSAPKTSRPTLSSRPNQFQNLKPRPSTRPSFEPSKPSFKKPITTKPSFTKPIKNPTISNPNLAKPNFGINKPSQRPETKPIPVPGKLRPQFNPKPNRPNVSKPFIPKPGISKPKPGAIKPILPKPNLPKPNLPKPNLPKPSLPKPNFPKPDLKPNRPDLGKIPVPGLGKPNPGQHNDSHDDHGHDDHDHPAGGRHHFGLLHWLKPICLPPIVRCPPPRVCPPSVLAICPHAEVIIIETTPEQALIEFLEEPSEPAFVIDLQVDTEASLEVDGLTEVPGALILDINGIGLPVEILGSEGTLVNIKVPTVGLSEAQLGKLYVLNADSQLVAAVDARLHPAAR